MIGWLMRILHRESLVIDEDRFDLSEIERRNYDEKLRSAFILEEAERVRREVATGNWATDQLFNRRKQPHGQRVR